MSDWGYVALGYAGTVIVLGWYSIRLMARDRKSRR